MFRNCENHCHNFPDPKIVQFLILFNITKPKTLWQTLTFEKPKPVNVLQLFWKNDRH